MSITLCLLYFNTDDEDELNHPTYEVASGRHQDSALCNTSVKNPQLDFSTKILLEKLPHLKAVL